jgi:hypothetical protein
VRLNTSSNIYLQSQVTFWHYTTILMVINNLNYMRCVTIPFNTFICWSCQLTDPAGLVILFSDIEHACWSVSSLMMQICQIYTCVCRTYVCISSNILILYVIMSNTCYENNMVHIIGQWFQGPVIYLKFVAQCTESIFNTSPSSGKSIVLLLIVSIHFWSWIGSHEVCLQRKCFIP